MSKAMPTDPPDGEKIAVFTPITLPSMSKVGPAGIAIVHGPVDLEIVVIRARTDVAAASRNNASRYRPTEAEWVANRNHPVADTRRRFRKPDEGKVTATIHLDQGEVGTR